MRRSDVRLRRIAPGLILPAPRSILAALPLWMAILLPWLPGCSEIEAPAPTREVIVIAEEATIMRGDSLTVSAELIDTRGSDLAAGAYQWSVDGGSVIGEGATITFVAPDSVGTVSLHVTVVDGAGNRHEGLLTISVHGQFVILKADDLVYEPGRPDGVPAGWRLFFDYIESHDLRASAGAIGQRMEQGGDEYFASLRALRKRGRVEFFNHGWSHEINVTGPDGVVRSEFRGTPYERQRDHLQATQALLRRRAGITLRGFGAPGNAIDETTARVVSECPELTYWFYGLPGSGKAVLPRLAEMEDRQNRISYEVFRATYRADVECLVYQIHPWFWTETQLAEFARCIDDLRAMGVTFILPTRYLDLERAPATYMVIASTGS